MFHLPDGYLDEEPDIPDFWLADLPGIDRFLDTRVHRGEVVTFGRSAGGRPIRAVRYGSPRAGRGTTTFSGSLGFRDVRAWLGPEAEKRVYLGFGGVHGGEFEGMAGIVNLLSVLETGADLRGKPWPELRAVADLLDRLILIPVVNVDGRARIPIRLEKHRGTDNTTHEYLNTGGWKDGSNLGWPRCKQFIPMDFATVGFPGGYPNDAGVNVQHDDFLGARQPETQMLFDLLAAERPDLALNLHTGAPPRDYYLRTHRPLCEPALTETFDALYRRLHTELAEAGLQGSRDPAVEADPARQRVSVYNLDTALNLHSGVLSVLIESPCHGFSGYNRAGEVVRQTPDSIVDAQLVAHRAAMGFLAETGGRCRWAG